eukprot:254408_1
MTMMCTMQWLLHILLSAHLTNARYHRKIEIKDSVIQTIDSMNFGHYHIDLSRPLAIYVGNRDTLHSYPNMMTDPLPYNNRTIQYTVQFIFKICICILIYVFISSTLQSLVAMNTSILYVLLILLQSAVNVKSQDICFWGRTFGEEREFNGLWTYVGLYNNKPYYSKTEDANCPKAGVTQYIWNTGTEWRVSTLGSISDTICVSANSDVITCNIPSFSYNYRAPYPIQSHLGDTNWFYLNRNDKISSA